MLFECDFKLSLLMQIVEISDAILTDLIFIFPACAIIEWQFDIHEYLVDVECCAFFVHHDGLSELSVRAGSVVVVVGVEVGVLERVLGLCLALHHSPHGCLLPTAEFSSD